MSENCPLTLVTSVLNGEPYIADLLASIPGNAPVEHLVIDAGSIDGTLDRLEGYRGIRLLARPGVSLYEAWNIGVDAAIGDAVWFVNADDLLAPGAVETALEALGQDPDADIVQGRAEAFADSEDEAGATPIRYPDPGCALELLDIVFGAPAINARIFRRRLLGRAGPFDARHAYAGDRAWLLRLALAGAPVRCRRVGATLYRYRIHGGSLTLSQSPARRQAIAAEHRRIATEALQATLPPFARAMLKAWRTRERAVEAVAAFRAGHPGDGTRALGWLGARTPAALWGLFRAGQFRRRALRRYQN